MTTVDRIPLRDRLLRPGYARGVALVADGLRRSGDEPLPVDARCAVEVGYEAGHRDRADARIVRRAPRVRRVAAAGSRRVARAAALLARLAGLDREQVVLDGRAMSVADLRAHVVALRAAAEADRHSRRLDRPGRLLRTVGVGLLLVDALALVIIFAFLLNLDWLRPDPANLITSVALALFGAAVQAVLAVHLGRRLWAWRHTDPDDGGPAEFPPRSAAILLGGGALAVVSAFAAGAIFLRVEREGALADAGALATALGLLLAASALAAPWCLVADEAYRPGPDALALRAGSRMLHRIDRGRVRVERRVRVLLERAAGRLGRAEWLLVAALHRVGMAQLAVHRTLVDARGIAWPAARYSAADLATARAADDPAGVPMLLPAVVPTDARTLRGPVERLREELAAARTEYALVVESGVRADHELAS